MKLAEFLPALSNRLRDLTRQLYHELGFDGPVRVDHVPTMAGESNEQPGYGSLGRLFAIGYTKGVLQSLKISIE